MIARGWLRSVGSQSLALEPTSATSQPPPSHHPRSQVRPPRHPGVISVPSRAAGRTHRMHSGPRRLRSCSVDNRHVGMEPQGTCWGVAPARRIPVVMVRVCRIITTRPASLLPSATTSTHHAPRHVYSLRARAPGRGWEGRGGDAILCVFPRGGGVLMPAGRSVWGIHHPTCPVPVASWGRRTMKSSEKGRASTPPATPPTLGMLTNHARTCCPPPRPHPSYPRASPSLAPCVVQPRCLCAR